LERKKERLVWILPRNFLDKSSIKSYFFKVLFQGLDEEVLAPVAFVSKSCGNAAFYERRPK